MKARFCAADASGFKPSVDRTPRDSGAFFYATDAPQTAGRRFKNKKTAPSLRAVLRLLLKLSWLIGASSIQTAPADLPERS